MPSKKTTRRAACRILLADDHSIVRGCIRFIAEAAGHRIVGEARDGLEAARLAGDLRPEVAILAISMPVLDGLAACRAIHRVSPRTRLIALSTDGDRVFTAAAQRAGFRGFVVKHLASEQLEPAIDAVRSGSSYHGTGKRNRPMRRAARR